MTLLFVDGFDHYATADLTKKWGSVESGAAINASAGRRSGGAFVVTASATASRIAKTLAASHASFVIGFSFKTSSHPTSSAPILRLIDTSSIQVDVRVNTDGTLSVTRNGTALTDGTSSSSLSSGVEYFIEFKVTIADSIPADSCKVRVNGDDWITVAAGQDTKTSTNASANVVRIGANAASIGNPVFVYDDLYVCNQSGSTNNDFLGDCRVDTLLPTSDGTYTDFTPSTGTDHFALVDEASVNTTDYNDGGASGDRDSYGMGNLSAIASSTVFGLQVSAALQKNDSGARSAGTMVRSGSTNSDGAGEALSTSQAFVCEIYEQDPAAAAAWTEATVNAMQAGVKVTA